MKYLLIDANNMFMRCRHVITASSELEKSSMALHLILNSIRKGWRLFNADHIVLACDGRSWRKQLYAPYKANRAEKDLVKTKEEREDDRIYYEALSAFVEFMDKHTNVTVLKNEIIEADDFVSRWIQRFPTHQHVIISSDADFKQLIAKNVKIYDGMKQEIISIEGYKTEKGDQVKDKKGQPVPPPDPEWLLFEKCMRGDSSDNIFSAYPGVRTKSLKDAYEDRLKRGLSWNNIMMHVWKDHTGIDRRVKEDYERNQNLIDLTRQPQEIKDLMDSVISEATTRKSSTQIGTHFLRFCGKWDLEMISKSSNEFCDMLGAEFKTE